MQSIKCECSKLDIDNNFFLGEISQIVSYWKWISDCRQSVPFMQRIIATIFSCFFRNWIRYSVCYQLYNSQSTEYNYLSVRTLENSDLLLCLRHCLFPTCSNRDRQYNVWDLFWNITKNWTNTRLLRFRSFRSQTQLDVSHGPSFVPLKLVD